MAKPRIGPGGKPMIGAGSTPLACEADEFCCTVTTVTFATCTEFLAWIASRTSAGVEFTSVGSGGAGNCYVSDCPALSGGYVLSNTGGNIFDYTLSPTISVCGSDMQLIRMRFDCFADFADQIERIAIQLSVIGALLTGSDLAGADYLGEGGGVFTSTGLLSTPLVPPVGAGCHTSASISFSLS